MWKVSPRIAGYAFLSVNIVLILGACVKPVDIKPFLKDEKVQEIINKGKANIDIGYEKPKDFPLELQAAIAGTPLEVAEDGTVTVSLDSLGDVTITVTNAADYDVIDWHYDSNPVAEGDTLNLGLMTDIFDETGNYPVTVIGKKGDKSYSTLVYINVES
jgi:hypothetical protein